MSDEPKVGKDGKVEIELDLPEDVIKKLEIIAKKEKKSIDEIVEDVLYFAIKREKEKLKNGQKNSKTDKPKK